jgi:hypothetical protein
MASFNPRNTLVIAVLFPVLTFSTELILRDFSMRIPDGWESASTAALRQYEQSVKETMNVSNSYDFGIQPSGRDTWFAEPPFILGKFHVQERTREREMGGIAEDLNEHFQSADVSESTDSDNAVLQNVFEKSTLGKPYFDRSSNSIWSAKPAKTGPHGLLHALTIQRLSPYGKLVLTAYASDNSRTRLVGIINRMVCSVRFPATFAPPAAAFRHSKKAGNSSNRTARVVWSRFTTMFASAAPFALGGILVFLMCIPNKLIVKLLKSTKDS